MCSKRAAPAMLALCWQIYICRDKPRARGKCARRSGGTGLKISCWLPWLYAMLSFSLSHALCHRALTCFAPLSPPRRPHPAHPGVWVSSSMKGFSKELVSLESGKSSVCSHQSRAPGEASAFKDPWKDKCDEIGTHVQKISGSWVFISKKKKKSPNAAFALATMPRWLNIYSGKCGWFSNRSRGKLRHVGISLRDSWHGVAVGMRYSV